MGGRLLQATLRSRQGGSTRLRLGDVVREVSLTPGAALEWNSPSVPRP